MGDEFLQSYKQCFSLADMEFLNHFSGLNQDHTCALNVHTLMGYPHDNISGCANIESFPSGMFTGDNGAPAMMDDKDRKRKSATDVSSSSDNGSRIKAHRGAGSRGKKVKKEEEKEREVIHVRAKRGEATDSHSLAERVRRGKINERLRCLQDIVPGCYKTMGMAVMLDEIINYVQSLQNQVEFLSMRLTAASAFHDFNSDTDALDAMHAQMQRAKTLEAVKGQQQEGGVASAAQFPQNFGYCPDQQPRTR